MKKIICFIIVSSILLILVVFGIIFKNKQVSLHNNEIIPIYESNIKENEITVATNKEEQLNEEIKQELEQQENILNDTTTKPTTEKNDNTSTKTVTTNVKNNNGSSIENKNPNNSTNITNQIKTEEKTNETNEKIQQEEQQTVIKDTPKNIKTYVRNTKMENTMKEYIEKNPSEYMINYGFTVVVDSTIVNDTSEFTYTEKRVKGKIANKFGTIKIYAHDVLLDGVYQFTECFIL